MKKIIRLILVLTLLLTAGGCGNTEKNNLFDVDLTLLSSTMVYSEVDNMFRTPDDYLGKSIKMNGSFAVYEDPESDKCYFACVIADATACCSKGLEFVLNGDYKYPEDYPELNSEITVEGIFDTYEENGNRYIQLINAKLA